MLKIRSPKIFGGPVAEAELVSPAGRLVAAIAWVRSTEFVAPRELYHGFEAALPAGATWRRTFSPADAVIPKRAVAIGRRNIWYNVS
ncbi:MAG TPA: hypothetical protein VN158_09380 [Caulobacter sp.]|nr:hypothetical protein [Caulobacter sp.]